jgi:hypothetical protein
MGTHTITLLQKEKPTSKQNHTTHVQKSQREKENSQSEMIIYRSIQIPVATEQYPWMKFEDEDVER